MDLVARLEFALAQHALCATEARAVEAELQRRLPAAIDGAFLRQAYGDLRHYAGGFGAEGVSQVRNCPAAPPVGKSVRHSAAAARRGPRRLCGRVTNGCCCGILLLSSP